jgi:hypothetical protein
MANIHIFRSPSLLSSVRDTLSDSAAIGPSNSLAIVEALQKIPLLNSVYAETLRMYSQAYITRCSPHNDIPLGRWTLPRNEVTMVSTYTAHHNEEYWNTKEGQYPVGKFWAERFLIDSNDPTSGPLRTDIDMSFRKPIKRLDPKSEPIFSTQGLDGIWIPYGGTCPHNSSLKLFSYGTLGGYGACPGRIFAKKLILYLSALMATRYDIEVLSGTIQMDTEKFGLGGQFPKGKVSFRIKERLEH